MLSILWLQDIRTSGDQGRIKHASKDPDLFQAFQFIQRPTANWWREACKVELSCPTAVVRCLESGCVLWNAFSWNFKQCIHTTRDMQRRNGKAYASWIILMHFMENIFYCLLIQSLRMYLEFPMCFQRNWIADIKDCFQWQNGNVKWWTWWYPCILKNGATAGYSIPSTSLIIYIWLPRSPHISGAHWLFEDFFQNK